MLGIARRQQTDTRAAEHGGQGLNGGLRARHREQRAAAVISSGGGVETVIVLGQALPGGGGYGGGGVGIGVDAGRQVHPVGHGNAVVLCGAAQAAAVFKHEPSLPA